MKISNVNLTSMTFVIYQACDLNKRLIKRKLLFHLDLINKCNVKMFSRRSLVINLINSGQQQFS
jgi:hypothetical protein